MTKEEIKLNVSPVRFVSDTHQYFLGGKELKGITTTLIRRAYPRTYEGVPQHILDAAAEKGSLMHETIELYDEMRVESELLELAGYKKVLAENKLEVLATEYVVSDLKNYATAIDKVMLLDGKVILVDLKRTSKIHTENVSLQLSICKRFFELLNPHIPVEAIYVLRLRDYKTDFVKLDVVSDEFIDRLIESDLNDTEFCAPQTSDDANIIIMNSENEIASLETAIKELKQKQDELKAGLMVLMEQYNIKSWTGERLKITRSLPTMKKTFDAARFKEEHQDLYDSYLVDKETAGALRITLLKQKQQ